jgi:hypothetical protein
MRRYPTVHVEQTLQPMWTSSEHVVRRVRLHSRPGPLASCNHQMVAKWLSERTPGHALCENSSSVRLAETPKHSWTLRAPDCTSVPPEEVLRARARARARAAASPPAACEAVCARGVSASSLGSCDNSLKSRSHAAPHTARRSDRVVR